MLDRQITAKKLRAFLQDEITTEDIYSWALGVVVASDYEKVSADLLLKKTIQDIIDLKHTDTAQMTLRTTLEYDWRCLTDQEKFVFVAPPPPPVSSAQLALKEDTASGGLFFLFKGYAVLFGVGILLVHIFSLINPQFFWYETSLSSRADLLLDCLPQMVYGACLVWSLVTMPLAPAVYYPVLAVLTMGMLAYWYLPLALVLKIGVSPFFIFLLVPFTSLPATFAMFVFLNEDNRP